MRATVSFRLDEAWGRAWRVPVGDIRGPPHIAVARLRRAMAHAISCSPDEPWGRAWRGPVGDIRGHPHIAVTRLRRAMAHAGYGSSKSVARMSRGTALGAVPSATSGATRISPERVCD